MSLFSALTSSVSGMAAQAFKLATISDNVANVNTTGYKQATTQFESLVQEFGTSSYNAAGVGTRVRYNISEQGDLAATASSTDLAVQGTGFFLVENAGGTTFLTRAGSFRQDDQGNLVNAAGFTLLGYSAASGDTSADGLGALTKVNVLTNNLSAAPSTQATFSANLDSRAAPATAQGNLPSTNAATAEYTSKSSLVAYDNLGTPVTLDLYFTKLPLPSTNQWELAVYNAADATPGTTFPYAQPPVPLQPEPLAVDTLNFNPVNGTLTGTSTVSVAVPNGGTMTIDLGTMTQVASPFAVAIANTDGSAPSALESVSVQSDGTLSGIYANGTEVPLYKVPIATVPAIDRLTVLPGNVFRAGTNSGDVHVGDAGLSGLGTIQSSNLESSTVDLASQLTDMIVAQRSYEANTKVFQTGSELLGLLNTMLK